MLKLKMMMRKVVSLIAFIILLVGVNTAYSQYREATPSSGRQRISLNSNWHFRRYTGEADTLIYDDRPKVGSRNDNVVADTRATDTGRAASSDHTLKRWILPTANNFIKDPAKHYQRPAGNPGSQFAFVQKNFNDSRWESVTLPHDWAAASPFYSGNNAEVGGGMGRLPIQGVAWYRRKLTVSAADQGKSIYLDIDGIMSYAMVWLNGNLVGGWPYGYNSFRLDLTPFVNFGGDNQIAIRVDNPNHSARWYPGAGIYRNVWLTKTSPLQVSQWGSFITTENVSKARADVHLSLEIENRSQRSQQVEILTEVYLLNAKGLRSTQPVAKFPTVSKTVSGDQKIAVEGQLNIKNPLLWGPSPLQQPNLYVAITRLLVKGKVVDEYETKFGMRSVVFDAQKGISVNGGRVRVQGVNQHHDLGALGAAFDIGAATRQLEILKELGCNAIRLSHNPPAPELLDLTDKMGFLVIDEIFDCWERGKTPLDFHLIFNDWHEADLRSFIRRDRNHPSIIAWSFGNEVGEQYTAEKGAELANQLRAIVHEEDSTRPATASMNYAKPDMPFPAATDILSLNYQGEGIRDAPAYSHLRGIKTTPLYSAFQKAFPDKLIVSSESASTLSSRGSYVFPVVAGFSAPVSDSTGGNSRSQEVSGYELYTAQFGASPDKVFATQDKNPYVAGEFVWSGWDYLGEPTPYYTARSSYSGIIDLAGFKKDRFYLYQSRWRPGLPMVHILPHWNWPGKTGQIVPVHIFTSGDEAELFLNGRSLGRKKKGDYEYRLRWDDVKYEEGELKAVAYKNGRQWSQEIIRTTGPAYRIDMKTEKTYVTPDGRISFVTIRVLDKQGLPVPTANNLISLSIAGAGKIAATDNGDPSNLRAFSSNERELFNGMGLVIIRTQAQQPGSVILKARSEGLVEQSIKILP